MNKVNEEAVVIVQDDAGEPKVLVRKSSVNGGKIYLYTVKPMTFADTEFFLKKLAGEEIKKDHAPGK